MLLAVCGIMLAAAGDASAQAERPAGDVLTPNQRGVANPMRLGVRLSLNRAAYSNDRYLNNVQFDVGSVNGEAEIYSSAAGFGVGGGLDLEYPLGGGFSLLGTAEFHHATFSSSGPVSEPCIHPDSTLDIGTSIHQFDVALDAIKLSLSAKVEFNEWYLLGGISAEHFLNTRVDRVRTLGTPGCAYPGTNGATVLEEHDPIPNPTRVHYALRLGGGIVYQLSKRLQFCPELTFDFGSGSINKSPNSDLGIYALSATLRYDL